MSDFQIPVTFSPTAATQTATPDLSGDTALDLALTLAQAAADRKAGDIRVLKVAEVSYLADYFVIVTGFSSAQVRAIARSMEDAAADAYHRHPLRTEGQGEGTWILNDYGEVISHIFMPDAREYYGLEAFWGHAEEIPFTAT